ncbi:MAG: sugar phosphate nucleotidyltransferase [Chthoniobacterales bacterium]
MQTVKSAFILAAGEGTRLRPLTESIPKPLLPVFHKPLITFAIDHLIALGIETIALNTRYLSKAFYEAFEVKPKSPYFGLGEYEGKTLSVFHEHVHLDTGGGLRNARSVLEQGTFLIHNGDILSDAPLHDLIKHHHHVGAMVTLLLRHEGAAKNVSYHEETGLIEGFSGTWNTLPPLLTKKSSSLVYAGIAVVEPEFLNWISPEGPASIIPALTKAIHAKQIVAGFIPSQNYFWSELGTPKSYLETHLRITQEQWIPPYQLGKKSLPWPQPIHPLATIDPSAILEEMVAVGAHAHIGPNAHLKNCILLPGATVPHNADFAEMIVGNLFSVLGR